MHCTAYIDGVLSLNNSKISKFVDIICPCQLEIKDTTEFSSSSPYLDCIPYTDNGKLYGRRDDLYFPII